MDSLHILCVIGILSVSVCLVSSECSGNGVKADDGTCNCNADYYGDDCECTAMIGVEACKSPDSTTTCSGRGKCVCGMCECQQLRYLPSERYTGQFCQCDDYSCFMHNNRICGGNGRCVCGECVCDRGFSGVACQYAAGGAGCVGPNKHWVCEDHGECINDKCQCDRNSIYTGLFCEGCPTCTAQCSRNYRCAECMAWNETDCSEDCGTTAVKMVDSLGGTTADPLEKLCSFQTKIDIIYTYVWKAKDGNYQVQVLRQKDVTSSSSVLRYSSYVVSFLVAMIMLF